LTKFNIAILLTAIFHGLIVLPLGHAGAPLIIVEFVSIEDIFSGDFPLKGGGGEYEASLSISTILSLIGHVLLLAALLFRHDLKKIYISWIGVILTLLSLINILVHADFVRDFIFLFSLPFLIAAIWLTIQLIIKYKEVKISASNSMWN
jgi:hypothetical protein